MSAFGQLSARLCRPSRLGVSFKFLVTFFMCTEKCAQNSVHRKVCTKKCAQKIVHKILLKVQIDMWILRRDYAIGIIIYRIPAKIGNRRLVKMILQK